MNINFENWHMSNLHAYTRVHSYLQLLRGG